MELGKKRVFLVGAKGTGMAGLAVVLRKAGAEVSGCDSAAVFPTDALLRRFGIPVAEGFAEDLLPQECDLVVYSAAYKPSACPVLRRALERAPGAALSYPEMIARLSEESRLYAVCGTHGKTTVCAAAAWLLSRPARRGFPFLALFGSVISGGEPVFQGTENILAEACEYQDHFLLYKTRGALATSAEMDHPDWFRDEAAVLESFEAFIEGLDRGGFLLVDADGANSSRLSAFARTRRRDLILAEYGFSAKGPFRLGRGRTRNSWTMALLPGREFVLPAFEPRIAADLLGAALLSAMVLLDRPDPKLYLGEGAGLSDEVLCSLVEALARDLERFPGVEGRMETVMEEDGVLYMRDYAHHPAEIAVCLRALRAAHPAERICVLFRPHTYSRTEALMGSFAAALRLADHVVVQKTYPSARGETAPEDNARLLAGRVEGAVYMEYDDEAAAFAAGRLAAGGICLALGAGNNSGALEAVRRLRRGKK